MTDEIPEEADLSHVKVLVLQNSKIDSVSDKALFHFTNLEVLILKNVDSHDDDTIIIPKNIKFLGLLQGAAHEFHFEFEQS